LKILVTGGAGYIGSVATADLVGAGSEVVVYDNLSSGNARAVPKGAQLVTGELSDRDLLKSVIRERELHWEPKFSKLEDIVGSAWSWRQQHPRGYKGDG
jgi:UDP-glucose 4-epimerase